ncbi:hypothetical protein [Actinoplanes sp. NPDC049118]|uniref:helix-turn-helix domain-containing protein n=1 Tax=Actinoplanes sp. NPDC049118 TaxID=3155769 RepID=UPI0033E5603B
MREQSKTTADIAMVLCSRYRVNARVAFRYVMGWSQSQVASEWSDRWPAEPKTDKAISNWEKWPNGGHAPSLQTLGRLAQLYGCSVSQLLSDLPDYGRPELADTPCSMQEQACEEPIVPSPSGLRENEAMGVQELGDILPSPGRREVRGTMQRRRVLGLGALVASSLGGVPTGNNGDVGRVGLVQVKQLDCESVRLRNLCSLHGGDSLWRAALGLAKEGYLLLEQGQYGEEVGEYLQQAIGRAEMCAGWLALDAGRHETARSSFNEALSLARQSGDQNLETHALCNLALQSNMLGMPRQALRFADAADRVSVQIAPKVRVVLGLRKATAHALMGDKSLSDNAMNEARRRLDREAGKPTVPWCSFVTQAEVDGVDGTRLLHLARSRDEIPIARRAERTLELAIAEHAPTFARNRALYRVRLAGSRLLLGSVPEAARYATVALKELSVDLASSIVSAELGAVAEAFSVHRGHAEVDYFLACYRAARKHERVAQFDSDS